MLIEQIIEFELRGPGPYLQLKYCKRQCTLISPTMGPITHKI